MKINRRTTSLFLSFVILLLFLVPNTLVAASFGKEKSFYNDLTYEELNFVDNILNLNKINIDEVKISRNENGEVEVIHILDENNFDVYTYSINDNQTSTGNNITPSSVGTLLRGLYRLYKIYKTGKEVCEVTKSISGFDGCAYLLKELKNGLSTKPVKYEVVRTFYKTDCPYPPHSFACNSGSFGYWKTSYRRVN